MPYIQTNPDLLIQKLEGEAVMLSFSSGRYFSLDPIGTSLWELLADYGETEAIIPRFMEMYEVEESVLRQDLAALIERLVAAGLATVHDHPPA